MDHIDTALQPAGRTAIMQGMAPAGEALLEAIRRLAKKEDLPVLGIGPSAPMENGPAGYRPSEHLPGARSMICFGLPAPRSVYRQGPHAAELIWRAQTLLYRRLDTLSLAFIQAIEAGGGDAVPVSGCCPLAVDRRGRVVGYLNQLCMAELTGIGIIGRSGLLLHRRYGARLMLGAVLTDLELPPMRFPDEKQPPCPPHCRICIESCPVQAISPHGRRVQVMRCLAYTASTPFMSRLRFAFLCRVRPEAAARLLNLRAGDERTLHVCSRCISACPYGEP
jgi:epoxyqueuosine reductase QueG